MSRRVLFLLLAFFLSFSLAQTYEWRDVVQRVQILPDGDIIVEDKRTLWTDDDFGEAYVEIMLEPHQRVTLLEGSGIVGPGVPGRAFQQPIEGGQEVVVRFDQRVQERRVRYRYRLEGTLDYYSDVVQWYWNILGREDAQVRGYRLEVLAPGAMEAPYDAYVHRYGNPEHPQVVLSPDHSRLQVTFERIPSNDGVEIRYLMDPALFEQHGAQPGLERLLQDETRIAGLRELMWSPWWALAVAGLVGFLGMRILMAYQKYGKEPDIGPVMQYPFEPPTDRPPAAVALFMSQLSPSMQHAFSATVMDLARRGYGTFDSKGRDFNFVLHPERDAGELTALELDVLKYLQRAAASGGTKLGGPEYLEFRELKRYSEKNLSGFMSRWSTKVKSWLEKQVGGPLLDRQSRQTSYAWAGFSFLGMFLCIAGLIFTYGTAQIAFGIGAAACFVLAITSLLVLPAWRKDIAPEVYGWQGFRRTLSDYSRMKDAPDDFFLLWDKYYCYAAALGVAERFLKNLQRAAPLRNMDQNAMMSRAHWMGSSPMNSSNLASLSRSVSAFSSALNSASASASSGGSSSGGGGGGGR